MMQLARNKINGGIVSFGDERHVELRHCGREGGHSNPRRDNAFSQNENDRAVLTGVSLVPGEPFARTDVVTKERLYIVSRFSLFLLLLLLTPSVLLKPSVRQRRFVCCFMPSFFNLRGQTHENQQNEQHGQCGDDELQPPYILVFP
jgi:hypothetical protein